MDREHAARSGARRHRASAGRASARKNGQEQAFHRVAEVYADGSRPPARPGPRVVAALEPLEHVDEQLEPVAVDPPGSRPAGPADVDPDPEHHALARLGEDPRHLAAVDQDVVRVLDRRGRPDRARDRFGRDERQLRASAPPAGCG